MGCFSTLPLNLGTTLLVWYYWPGFSASLMAMMMTLVALTMLVLLLVSCSVRLTYFSYGFLRTAFCESDCILYIFICLLWNFLPSTPNTMQHILYCKMVTPLVAHPYVIYSMCLVWLWYLNIYVQWYIYIQLSYVQVAWLWIWVYVCYWLSFGQYVIGWTYFTTYMHLYERCVIMDGFVSLFIYF